MIKEFTLHYHKLKFSFKYQSSNLFNFSSLKESIINFLKLDNLINEDVFLFYIDSNNNNEKIEISNDEDLNQVIKFDNKYYSKNKSIPLEIKIEKKDEDFEEDDSSDDNNFINSKANLDITNSVKEKTENSRVQFLNEKFNLIQKNTEKQNKKVFEEIPFSNSINLKDTYFSEIIQDNQINIINKKEPIKNNEIPNIDMKYPEKGFSIFCDKCGGRIIEHRFLCLICENFNLCYNCFKFHSNQHPMIVESKGNNEIYINNKNDIKSILKNQVLSKNIFQSLFNKKKSEYCLELNVPEHQKIFNMPVLSSKKIDLYVQNIGKDIKKPIYIFLRDSRNLKINVGYINELKTNQSCLINIEIITNNLIHQYNPTIHLFSNNIKLNYEPINLVINVKSKKDCDELNIKIFDKYQNIKKWKKENKIKLYDEYFNNNLKEDLNKINELKINGDNYWELIKYMICTVEN